MVVAPTTMQPQPVLSAADRALLQSAAGGDSATFRIVVAGDARADRLEDLTPYRDLGGGRREVEHGPRRGALIEAALARVDADLAGLAPDAGAPDLLGAIGRAARLAPDGTMIVRDSGLQTVDPLDVRLLGWDTAPATIVDDLRSHGLIPDLAGWQIRFAGLGEVANAQPPPALPQRSWLADLWLGICRAGGAAGCVEEYVDGSGTPPLATRVAPVVPMPVIGTRHGADGTVTEVLPAARLGFTEGSALLPAAADGALGEVVGLARSGGYHVEVAGYVAFWGSDAYRQQLSAARAIAVADRLVALGVPRALVRASGLGAADGAAASETGGVFDEAKVRGGEVRRVVITLRPDGSNQP